MRRPLLTLLLLLLSFAAYAQFEPDFIDYLLADEKYEQVIRVASRQLERHPKDGRLYTQRATAYLQLNSLDSAINDLSSAIRYHKTASKPLPELYHMRGVLYDCLGEPKKAQRDLKRAEKK